MPPVQPRRTRTVAPVRQSEEAMEVLGEVPAALRSKSQVRRVQAAVADPKTRVPVEQQAVDEDGELRVPISGKQFRLADEISLMALMEFTVAASEIDASDGSQLLALYRMLQSVVHEDEWTAFRKHTREAKSDTEDFMNFQNAALEALAARPTEEPELS